MLSTVGVTEHTVRAIRCRRSLPANLSAATFNMSLRLQLLCSQPKHHRWALETVKEVRQLAARPKP